MTVTAAAPGTKHWVGAYSPPRAAVNATAPVKYAILHDVDASYLKTGEATARFRLACNRHDYDFVAFADDWERRQYNDTTHARSDTVHEAVAVARSAVATMAPGANRGPRKPRVSLVSPEPSERVGSAEDGDDLELAVTWSSARGAEAMPRLRWWEEDASGVRTSDVKVVDATSYRYGVEDLCGAPATTSGYRDPGWIHRAALRGIDRSTVRFVGYDLTDALGGAYPPAGERGLRIRVPRVGIASSRKDADKKIKNDQSPFTIAMFADMGRGTDDDAATWNEYGSPAFNTSRALAADADVIDAAFLFGDVSYATGYQSVWDDYLEMIAPWAARLPFLVNPGNHEYDYVRSAWAGHAGGGGATGGTAQTYADVYGGVDSGGECGVPVERLLPGPTPAPSSVPGAYVAILGPIALVSMNTEVDFRTNSPQWTWLDEALGSIDRSITPWVLFAGHRPGLVDSDWGKSCAGVDADVDDRAWTCGPKKPNSSEEGNEGSEEDLRDASDVGVALEFQSHVWPLLTRYRVNAAFSGHNHVYQRHCAFDPERVGSGIDSHLRRIRELGPGDDADDAARSEYGKSGGCVARPSRIMTTDDHDDNDGEESEWWVYDEPNAPVSLVVGSAGAGFTRNSVFSLTKGTETCEFCEAVMYEFGYLRVAAVNGTHLRCEFVETQRGNGAVLDRFYITQRGVAEGAEGAEGAEDEVTSGWRFIAFGCALALFVACFAIDVFVPQDVVLPYVRLDSIDEDGEEEEEEEEAAVDGEV